ncbi:unnamed protein product [Laminaria digitata]
MVVLVLAAVVTAAAAVDTALTCCLEPSAVGRRPPSIIHKCRGVTSPPPPRGPSQVSRRSHSRARARARLNRRSVARPPPPQRRWTGEGGKRRGRRSCLHRYLCRCRRRRCRQCRRRPRRHRHRHRYRQSGACTRAAPVHRANHVTPFAVVPGASNKHKRWLPF